MKILKFGGSSVATASRIGAVVEIVARAHAEGRVAVVVSALGGVTDLLQRCLQRAGEGEESYDPLLDELRARHRTCIEVLAPAAERASLLTWIDERVDALAEVLHGVRILGEASPRTSDRVLAFGERLATPVVAAALRAQGIKAEATDARALLITDDHHGAARLDAARTYPRIRDHFEAATALQVVTGFIAATEDGVTTTLGRGGSDTTASILGAALDAAAVELWTDVDGVMSADPRLVPDAVPLATLSYEELMELSHFGAKVVHPPSVQPIRSRGIPLVIKNTFRPTVAGTRVLRRARVDGAQIASGPVCGVTSIRPLALLRLEGEGLVGPGTAGRLFAALAGRAVNVVLISQASSEHSICFAVVPDDVGRACAAVEEAFALERKSDLVQPVVVEPDMAVIAVVGAGMREHPGIAARLFAALGAQGINVRAIAQGSSERNVSLVVHAKDERRAVDAVHNAFFIAGRRSAEVAVAGVGAVGTHLLQLLAAQREDLEREAQVTLRLVGVANSRHHRLATGRDADGLDPETAADRLAEDGEAGGGEALVRHLTTGRRSLRIFVDCTASEAVAAGYDGLLKAGVAVVTANKLRLAGPLKDYRAMVAARPGRLYYETTVGAGLPVIRTLADLLVSGDRLRVVEGVFSGTLGLLTHRLTQGMTFSAAVREAHRLGFTEPDPRDDLGGHDVARKLLIVARLAGLDLEPEALTIEPLLPSKPWGRLTLEAFWEKLPEMDENFAQRVQESAARGERLCYLARIAEGAARVGLISVAADHPCASLRGGENLIAFHTDRYGEEPLVVRGPGAGPERTAAGVYADVVRAITESGELS